MNEGSRRLTMLPSAIPWMIAHSSSDPSRSLCSRLPASRCSQIPLSRSMSLLVYLRGLNMKAGNTPGPSTVVWWLTPCLTLSAHWLRTGAFDHRALLKLPLQDGRESPARAV